MPELPEITVIARQMSKEIVGKRIAEIEVLQPKNLNISVSEFADRIKDRKVKKVSSHGKWLSVELDATYFIMINLGMGAELVYFASGHQLPEKYQFRLTFSDKTGFIAHFWWFGYIHLVPKNDLKSHKLTAHLGKSALDETFTLKHLKESLAGRKTTIKSFLLDQKNVAGIGNVYAQDILFEAKLHPNRKISSLASREIVALYKAIRNVLSRSIRLHGLAYEVDFYGRRGRFTGDDFLVGYKAGKPCPRCNTTIEKIRTGSTSSYVCLKCQALDCVGEKEDVSADD